MPKEDYGNVEITYDMLADRGKRFANNFIDYIIYIVLTIAVGLLGNWLFDNYGFNGLAVGDLATLEEHPFRFNLLQLFVSIIFYGLFESLLGRTPAKYITGTKVVMRDGTKPDSTAIFIRTLCRQIPLEALSFLFGQFAVGWHDRISKTLVIDVNKYKSALQKKERNSIISEEEIN
jgi:uncharacterized RDD family membrane protein YckC